MSEPRQPWATGDGHPVTDESLKVFLDRIEERARAREDRMKVFLALVPLLWGAIAFLFWRFVLPSL
jgi:hypothetical protein